VFTRLLSIASYRREVTIEGIDDGAIALRIHAPVAPSEEFTCRRFVLIEGCTPLPQHENSLANECSYVKA
jgi:hypothetical protein